MQFRLTAEQQKFELEFKDYLKRQISPELLDEIFHDRRGRGPHHKQFIRQLGKDGWLGIGWPKEYGGQARSAIEQYILFDLVQGYYGIYIPGTALNCVGPVLMKVGTEEQKKKFLPTILKGEMEIAIGYTEPEAGSDLASLKTKAVRDGDDYVINGSKIFISSAHICDYIWLAVRTDPEARKSRATSPRSSSCRVLL